MCFRDVLCSFQIFFGILCIWQFSHSLTPNLIFFSLNLSFSQATSDPADYFQLICGQSKIQVGVDSAGLMSSGLDPFSGNLVASNCSWVRYENDTVWYEVMAREGACGTVLRVRTSLERGLPPSPFRPCLSVTGHL